LIRLVMFMYYIIILYQCLITFYDVLCVARRKLDVPAMFDVFFLEYLGLGIITIIMMVGGPSKINVLPGCPLLSHCPGAQ
jgi:hypothetical protein